MARWLLFAVLALLLWAFATTPMSMFWQTVSATFTIVLALLLRRRDRAMSMLMMALSLAYSLRYLYWRFSETMPVLDSAEDLIDLFFGTGLVLAETYAFLILVLGYFQVLWPLQRQPSTLPADPAQWPNVDIYIPTYNEPLSVVKPTVLAALQIDWPKDRMTVYLLDDGRRPEFADFAAQVGAIHITRPDNKHAKAGNINHALGKTRGEYIAIFDCDHIPTRSFLQLTLGSLTGNPNMALVQTPHHFFSPDPFERNLDTFREVPNEGELFYGLLQDGNDFWNATFFCGSCAVIRRSALEAIGGLATETVTEDAHTALRMHQCGWDSCYINVPQAAGLATESLSAHVGQRIRWARGMAQIFRLDNPLFAKGLKFGQRLCYANAMMHFFYGIPRLVFLTSPMAFLLFGAEIIRADALTILAYALPHLILAVVANSRVQGRYRHSWWAEVYETVLAAFIILPTTLAIINPKLGKFNVTAKGGIVDRDYFDGNIALPYFLLYLLNIVCVSAGIGRVLIGDPELLQTVYLNMAWAIYNLVILGAALSVAGERKQWRNNVRVADELVVDVRRPGSADVVRTTTFDVSIGGAALAWPAGSGPFAVGEAIEVALESPGRRQWLAGTVRRAEGDLLTLEFLPMTLAEESSLTQSLFGRADAWLDWRDRSVQDRPLAALAKIFAISLDGSRKFWGWVATQALGAVGIGREPAPGRKAASLLLAAALAGSLLGHSGDASAQPAAAEPATTAGAAEAAPATREVADPFAVKGTSGGPRATSDKAVHETTRTLSFADLGIGYPLRLSGTFAQASISLPLRRDQVVTAAKLQLRYAHSPSLEWKPSNFTVFVNDEVVDTFTLAPETAARGERIVELNPALFLEFNQIRFDASMHIVDPESGCEDAASSALWSIVSNTSTIELTLATLPQPSTLARLPRPFFEPNDPRRLRLPVAFASRPSPQAMTAAGIVASWFGALADYRGADFPVSQAGGLPAGHAIVLRSGKAFERQLGPVPVQAQIRVVDHPEDAGAKLLVLEAPTDAALIEAAQLLALGGGVLDSAVATVDALALPPPPPRGVAPRWIDPSMPTPLAPLAVNSTSVSGLSPPPVQYEFRLPPDLWFYDDRASASLDLHYRYGAAVAPGSQITTLLNDGFVGATPLQTADGSPATTGVSDGRVARLSVPSGRFGARNRLSFQYQFKRGEVKPCDSVDASMLTGAIDPDTKLSFGEHGRYAHWPDLRRFRDGGLPFSLSADYGQTAILVPDNADEDALSAALLVAGHFGQVTGSPALRIAIDGIGNGASYADRDLMLIGRSAQLKLPQAWLDSLPLTVSADRVALKAVSKVDNAMAWVAERDLDGARRYAGNVITGSIGELGLIIGGRSPFGSGSAVWITSGKQLPLLDVAALLGDPSRGQFIEGDVALLRAGTVSGYQLGDVWGIGQLPLHRHVRQWLAERPWLLVPLPFVFALLFVLVVYGLLSRRAARRLAQIQR